MEPYEDPEHRDYVPTVMPACYGKKVTERLQEQAESRHQRLLNRRAAAKIMEEEKQHAEEEAERLRLEAATTLIDFSQQEFIRDIGIQTNKPPTNSNIFSVYKSPRATNNSNWCYRF